LAAQVNTKKEEEKVGQLRRAREVHQLMKPTKNEQEVCQSRKEINKKFANQVEEQERSIDESNRGPPIKRKKAN